MTVTIVVRPIKVVIFSITYLFTYLLVPVYKLVHYMCCLSVKLFHILEFSLSYEFHSLEDIDIIVLIRVGFLKGW